MTKTVLSIFEKSEADARATLQAATGVDAAEIRVDGFAPPGAPVDFAAFRELTSLPLIYTRRGAAFDPSEAQRAVSAGFERVDIELSDALDPATVTPFASRAILSFHDYESTPDLVSLLERMRSFGAAAIKIAVTPRRFDDNLRILETLRSERDGTLTLFGMGGKGLYSRILAPFFGSELAFVAAREEASAAPGQLTVARAREVWGSDPLGEPEAIFAVAGNPAAHSLSPAIHNPRFRQAGLRAAYSVAEVESLDEVADSLESDDRLAPRGLSVTAPFKRDAYAFALKAGAALSDRARRCGAVNTLVRLPDGSLVADNTDVEGIAAGLGDRRGGSAAIIGTGGTAKAALVALRDAGFSVAIYGRSPEAIGEDAKREGATLCRLEELDRFDGEVLVDTTSASALVTYPPAFAGPGRLVIDAAYTPDRADRLAILAGRGLDVFGGASVLEAQALSQSRYFFQALGRSAA